MHNITISGDLETIGLALYNLSRGECEAIPTGTEITELHEHEGWIFYRKSGDERYHCLIDPRFEHQSFDTIEQVKQAIDQNL